VPELFIFQFDLGMLRGSQFDQEMPCGPRFYQGISCGPQLDRVMVFRDSQFDLAPLKAIVMPMLLTMMIMIMMQQSWIKSRERASA
jgi:hypothetical protein